MTVVRIIPARAGPTPGAVVEEWCDSDHPRSCGANVVRIRRLTVLTGSSPLVRGQRRTVVLPRFAVRIIPARAGPTLGRRLVENHRTGSSPLVRGQPAHATYYLGVRRIIPARAGPTSPPPRAAGPPSDHPRSCGANAARASSLTACSGSSPLVRGQRIDIVASASGVRIIPARAGPTRRAATGRTPASDHPRSCGANPRFRVARLGREGSSPLVRGQRRGGDETVLEVRIIPARAGPTRGGRPHCNCGTDHPRSCGANVVADSSDGRGCGSSPLVRGQRGGRNLNVNPLRIIPARAGPTTPRPAPTPGSTDHPRSCGANQSPPNAASSVPGSSPLVRGQRPAPS